ncbi:MAG: protein kinase domain-containing protein [Vicinamibacterales bacterium]
MTTVFQRVGPYDIVREIGRGGMAAVFLADDSRHSRQVALKLVPIGQDREAREILDAERWGARLQGQLARACGLVPRVYEEGDEPPYYFIAMEYVHGENLSDVIARGPVNPTEAGRIASELGRFLDAAHQFRTSIDGREFWSLVHGDLKPRNVRLSESGDIKVLDFGIAKALSLSRKVTRNDFGSMPYLSPERLESTEVDPQADLWALGVILYELLSGALPFHASDTRHLELEIRAGYGRRPLPETCPAGLRAIVARLLAAKVIERYPSAAAVVADLDRVRSGQDPEALTFVCASADEAPTRRTRPAGGLDLEATRRTDRSRTHASPITPVVVVPGQSTQSAPQRTPSPGPAARIKQSRRLRTALMIGALLLVSNELIVGFRASRIAAAAATRDLDGMDEIWSQYDALSQRSYLRMGIHGLERTLTTRAGTLSDQVIANYRSTVPTVRERQWQIAQRNLQRAVVLAPGDATLKASLRYCEGHLHRIAGEADKLRHHTATSSQHFTEAVSAFREAAELRRGWPDPFLGLARVFIYGLEDVDRASDALKQAEKLGYTIGDRETAQLADGYRARGDSLWQTARQLADMPQETEYLQRATDAYRQAQGLYERIPGFPGVALSLRRMHRSLDQINERSLQREQGQELTDPAEAPSGAPVRNPAVISTPRVGLGSSDLTGALISLWL